MRCSAHSNRFLASWNCSRLADERVDCTGVKSMDGPSDQSIIYVDPAGEYMIDSTAGLSGAMEPTDIAEPLSSIAAGDTLLMQGNLSFATTSHCLALAHQRNARTVVNPAPITFDYTNLWQFIDTVIVNEVECQVLTGERPDLGIERMRRHGRSSSPWVQRVLWSHPGANHGMCLHRRRKLSTLAGRETYFVVSFAQRLDSK